MARKRRPQNAEKTQFRPGQPQVDGAGRKIDAGYIRELAQSYSRDAIEMLGKLIKSKKRPDLAVRAAESLLDRAWGKPKVDVAILDARDPLGIAELRSAARELLSDGKTRLELRAALRAESVRSGPPDEFDVAAASAALSVPRATVIVEPPAALSDALADWWVGVFNKYQRVAICGGPGTGKTTLSMRGDHRPVIHTDDWIDRTEWEGVPTQVIAACGDGPVIVEGVQVARCLRKGLKVDAVVWLERARREQTRKQLIMTAGIRTVFLEWQASDAGRTPVLNDVPE